MLKPTAGSRLTFEEGGPKPAMPKTRTFSRAGTPLNGERGAALITALLISMLLLTGGLVLAMTTTMSGINTVDATSEMQAYYAAEAGIQATLNVLRNRVPPNVALAKPVPSPDYINLRVAVDPSTSNLAKDPASSGPSPAARLSRWLPYSAAYPDRVALSPDYSPYKGGAYAVVLADPDDPTGALRNSSADYLPTRLLITVNGYGPRGAQKRLQLLVTTLTLDYSARAMLAMIGSNTPADTMNFQIGGSSAKSYSGQDNSNPSAPPLASFAVTTAFDKVLVDTMLSQLSATNNVNQQTTVNNPGVELISDPTLLPWYLQSADQARSFLEGWRQTLPTSDAGTYYPPTSGGVPALNGNAGSNSHSFTFVDGDCVLTGGSGLLIVTGDLITKGNVSFSGLVLVLGKGRVIRSGGGNGKIFGAMAVASFGATGGFVHPTFDMSGGGNMTMQYDKAAVDAARSIGKQALGVVEN